CRHRFFSRSLLRVGPWPQGDEDPDPLDRGRIAHACFEEALRSLIQLGLVPYCSSLREKAEAVAEEAARRTADRLLGGLGLGVGILELQREELVQKVRELVGALYGSDDGFQPLSLEVGFGFAKGWPGLVVPNPEGEPIRVHGRLDLVEFRDGVLRVSELKS